MQEIENDIELQILQHKVNRATQQKNDRTFKERVLNDL